MTMAECKKLAPSNSAVMASSPTVPKTYVQQEHGQQSQDGACTLEGACKKKVQADVDVREVYFLIMHFLSESPCQRAYTQLRNELLENSLLPRRYHAWYSRTGACSRDADDDGVSLTLSNSDLMERFSFIEKDHLVKLLQQLLIRSSAVSSVGCNPRSPTAVDASTLLGLGSVSLLNSEQSKIKEHGSQWRTQLRWPHGRADQVHALAFREFGGGFTRHHRAPSIRASSYAIAKASVLIDRIQIIKTFRGHRNSVYCAIFDQSGEYIITGSDDRLVKIWSTATGFCLCSCRGHDGDITDLAVSSSNNLVASASNDCIIRVWRFPDGAPLSVLRGHTSAVTVIAFSPRPGCEHHLLSSSDDGTCRIWDARDSSVNARIYSPKPETLQTGSKAPASVQPNSQSRSQILCCAFNASGTIFATGSADKLARVWDACKWTDEPSGGPNHELDTLKGHEDDVNYVQFSGCAALPRPFSVDATKDERLAKFRNFWFTHESIVTCSRDGSAIIWIPRPRKYHGKSGRWTKSHHLRVPPPPMPPQPPRGGGPRQRLLPTPRGVNMIVWSLDKSFVLAAIMDCRICVWNAVDGSLVHSLTGHTKSTFVLDVHPYDPRIAMSAGYDGRVIIWDIWEGHPIRVYETGDYNLVDGKFSPDGTSIVISDEVGQIYLLATGQGESQKDAKYDQFFLGDYRPLTRDVHGYIMDQETQLSPHIRNLQDLLCDANMIPYPEPYQSMYQQRRLGALGISWRPPSVQLVVGTMDDGMYIVNDDHRIIVAAARDFGRIPLAQEGGTRWVEQPLETDDAMEWEHTTVDDSGSDYTASVDDASDEDERVESQTCSEDFMDSLEEEESSADEHCQRVHLRRSERNKRKGKGIMLTSSGRLVKRKLVDDGYDSRITRSKRHKIPKNSRQGSSSRRESDNEFSRRPRRMAARNARLIFSQIGDSEEEDDLFDWQKHQSPTSEHIDCADEQQRSAGISGQTDHAEHNDIGVFSMDAEQSDIGECLHSKRSNLIKLRVCAHNLQDEMQNLDDPADVHLASNQLVSESKVVEEMSAAQKSVPLQSGGELERSITEGYQDNALEIGSEMGKLEVIHACIEEDDSSKDLAELSHDTKIAWELKLLKAAKNPPCNLIDNTSAGKLHSLNDPNSQMNVFGSEVTPESSESFFQTETKSCQDDRNNNDYRGVTSCTLVEPMQKCMPEAVEPTCVTQDLDDVKEDSHHLNEDVPAALICEVEAHMDDVALEESGHFSYRIEDKVTQGMRAVCGERTEPAVPGTILVEASKEKQSEGGTEQKSCSSALDRQWAVSLDTSGNLECEVEAHTGDVALEESGHFSYQIDDKVTQDMRSVCGERTEPVVPGAIMVEASKEKQSEGGTEKKSCSDRQWAISLDTSGNCGQTEARDDQSASGMGHITGSCIMALVGCEKEFISTVQIEQTESIWKNEGLENNGSSVHIGPLEGTTHNEESLSVQDYVKSEEPDDAVCEEIGGDAFGKTPLFLFNETTSVEEKEATKDHASALEGNYATLQVPNTVRTFLAAPSYVCRSNQETGCRGKRTSLLRSVTGTHHRPARFGLSEPMLTGQREGCGVTKQVEGNEATALISLPGKGTCEGGAQGKRMSRRCKTPTSMSLRQARSEHEFSEPVNSGQEERVGNAEAVEDRINEGNSACELDAKEPRFPVRLRRNSIVRKDFTSENDEGSVLEALASWKAKGGRSKRKVSWLMLTEFEEGTRYIPQAGDDVAYVMQGHEEFLNLMHVEDKGPWKIVRVRLKAVEICRVVQLEYCSLPGFGNTCCRLTLKFIDEESKAFGRSFKLYLPELTDFSDFLIEKNRYDAAMKRHWTKRDKCKVWWRSEDGKGGQWWSGRVVAVEAKSNRFPDSPWDRYIVQYTGDSSGLHRHSPWELFDHNSTEGESSHIDDLNKADLLATIGKVEELCKKHEDEYGLRKLRQLINRSDFLNKTPVPLSLETIKSRLLNNYYRSLEALKHDAWLLVLNAEFFLGEESALTAKMRRLVNFLLQDN